METKAAVMTGLEKMCIRSAEMPVPGAIDVKKIVTHEFRFEDAEKAFNDIIANKETVIKGVIAL